MLQSVLIQDLPSEKQQVSAFVSGFSIETTPKTAEKVGDYRQHLRPGTRVMITHLPGSDFLDTIRTAAQLKSQGFAPVPHVAARNIPSLRVFEDYLKRLQDEVGVDEVLALGGGASQPAGDLHSSMQLIRTGLFERHGIRRIGVAGHPEGSPDIPDGALADALREKNEYAAATGTEMYLITQFCFEAQPIIAWDAWLQQQGNTLPVRIGVPGLATIKTLLGHAKACGVGASMRVLTRTPVTKLMATKSPGRLLADLTAHVAYTPGTCIQGVHMYPLGGLGRTAKYTYAITDGEFELQPAGDRIRVTAAID